MKMRPAIFANIASQQAQGAVVELTFCIYDICPFLELLHECNTVDVFENTYS